jgi:hypothetical protein
MFVPFLLDCVCLFFKSPHLCLDYIVKLGCHGKYVYGHGIESAPILLQIKQKQKGSDRILMPSVEGQQAGKWVVIDSGNSNISYFHPSNL